MSEIRPRITGTEMEWAVLTRKGEREVFRQASAHEVTTIIKHRDERLLGSEPYYMLSNGARYYPDVGNHPEYATAEDTSLMGTVANEFAGEQVVYDSLVNAQQAGVFHDFILNKRVVDDELRTWGYHMSLSADAAKVPITSNKLMPLGVHLATMNVYTGAGAVIPTKHGAIFTTAQKALNLNTDYARSTHLTEQPLISLRSEPLASANLYSRVHATSLDANMSPWASWMKLGTTSIVLRLMEQGYLENAPYFKEPMHKTAVQVAYDPSLKHPVELVDGSTILPIDVQGELALQAEKLAKNGGLTSEEELVLAEWKRVLSDLATDPTRTGDRVEWVAKRIFLRKFMARHALGLSSPEVLRIDRRWSHIGPDSIGMKLREKAWSGWMPSSEQLEDAYVNPPKTTRALGRASLIREHSDSSVNLSVYWATAKITDDSRAWSMLDPYEVTPQILPNASMLTPAFIGPLFNPLDCEPEDTDY